MSAAADRSLHDRAAIGDVLMRYFSGIDRGDVAMVRSCFTDDVRAEHHGHGADEGIEALMGWLGSLPARLASGEVKTAMHFAGPPHFERLDPDAAETETCALAFLVRPGDPDRLTVRGLRYFDRFRRTAEGWKISERRHALEWSSEQSADFAATVAERARKDRP